MNDLNRSREENRLQNVVPTAKDLGEAVNDLCKKAAQDAKSQLHPLLQSAELRRLSQREDFLSAFKSALEQRIARTLAAWQPGVQAVFKYEEARMNSMEHWDGSIHLLVKVPRLSDAVRVLAKKLDKSLVKSLREIMWQRFQTRQSILEVNQVTPNELRHGVGYGAMFSSVYTAPVKVWQRDWQAK